MVKTYSSKRRRTVENLNKAASFKAFRKHPKCARKCLLVSLAFFIGPPLMVWTCPLYFGLSCLLHLSIQVTRPRPRLPTKPLEIWYLGKRQRCTENKQASAILWAGTPQSSLRYTRRKEDNLSHRNAMARRKEVSKTTQEYAKRHLDNLKHKHSK